MKQNSLSSLAAAEKYAPFKFQDTLRNYQNPPTKKIKCCRIINACSHSQSKQKSLNAQQRIIQLASARQQYKNLFRNQNRKIQSRYSLQQRKGKIIMISQSNSLRNEQVNDSNISNIKNIVEFDIMSNYGEPLVALKECDNNQMQNRGQIPIENQNHQEIIMKEENNIENLRKDNASIQQNNHNDIKSEKQVTYKIVDQAIQNDNERVHQILQGQIMLQNQDFAQQRQNGYLNFEEIYDNKNQLDKENFLKVACSQQFQPNQIVPFSQTICQYKNQPYLLSIDWQQQKLYTQTTIKSSKQNHQILDGKTTPNSRFRIKSGTSQCLISTRVLQKSIRHLNDVDKMIQTILIQRPYLSQSTTELKQAIKQHLKLQ